MGIAVTQAFVVRSMWEGSAMEELKPCPFCGHEAVIKDLDMDCGGMIEHALCGCPSCHIFFESRPSRIIYEMLTEEDIHESRSKVIGMWNRRA